MIIQSMAVGGRIEIVLYGASESLEKVDGEAIAATTDLDQLEADARNLLAEIARAREAASR